MSVFIWSTICVQRVLCELSLGEMECAANFEQEQPQFFEIYRGEKC